MPSPMAIGDSRLAPEASDRIHRARAAVKAVAFALLLATMGCRSAPWIADHYFESGRYLEAAAAYRAYLTWPNSPKTPNGWRAPSSEWAWPTPCPIARSMIQGRPWSCWSVC